MTVTHPAPAAALRTRLDHPVIDSDGHLIELTPVLLDYVKQAGGGGLLHHFEAGGQRYPWMRMTLAERRETGTQVQPWWAFPAGTLDRATASLPRLLNERLDELGIDFCVLYPSLGLRIPHLDDAEARRVGCRALNTYLAEVYGAYPERMTPAAVIPMHTPEEAIAELEYVVKTLGLKAAMIAGFVRRPIPRPADPRNPEYLDTYGPESPYDYDPFWARCVALDVAPAAHSLGMGVGFRRSMWNYMYNHVGHFAQAGEALCKSLFFGGVTRRFPTLRVAFLEGGVGWACDVYAGIVGRWQKRNPAALRRNLDPAQLDRDRYMALFDHYAEPSMRPLREDVRAYLENYRYGPDEIDDWRFAGITRAEDIRDRFVPSFFFGCEADDPMNAWAFAGKLNPFGARLNAILSSDIGHWDAVDMRVVLEEAYELVEREALSPADFRDFVFANPARLYAEMNPDFFRGTRVQDAVTALRSPAR
jgi:predicted TIM-barrel fold metal-dependent hydrolase